MGNLLRKYLLCTGIALVIFASGCANHIKTHITKESHIKREPVSSTYMIIANDEVAADSYIRIEGKRRNIDKITTEEHEITRNIVTPYQGYRESYEIPLGFLAFPAAFSINIVDFFTLGFIPNWMTDDLLDYSFTGINPFMNHENEERVEKHVIAEQKRILDTKEEIIERHMPDIPITVELNTGQQFEFNTDKEGKWKVSLMKFMTSDFDNFEQLRFVNVSFKDKNQNNTLVKQITISRRLRYKLFLAKELVSAYRKDDTPEALAKAVVGLERLKFNNFALEFELENLNKHKEQKNYTKRFNTESGNLIKKIILTDDSE